MKRISFVLVFIVLLGLMAFIYIVFYSASSEAKLIVLLRCEQAVEGALSVSVLPNGKVSRFDVDTVCEAGKFVLRDYQPGWDIQTHFEHGAASASSELISTYKTDIQADPSDYYLILNITSAPPFINNGRI